MKNLYTYISPNGKMDDKHTKMLEIQIDNSLRYWDIKDILFFANFPFEYHGVKAVQVPDLINSQYPQNPRAIINSKINVIIHILENKLLTETAWFHDFDAFQTAPIDLKLKRDMGCVCYGIYPQWIFKYWGKGEGKLGENPQMTEFGFPRRINFGNVFFKPESLDIFEDLLDYMDKGKYYEEDAMTIMLEEGYFPDRIQILDQSYNLGIRCVRDNMRISEKPIKVMHFPPNQERWLHKFRQLVPDNLKILLDEKFINIHPPK